MANKQKIIIDDRFELFWETEYGDDSLSFLSIDTIAASKRWAKKCFDNGFNISLSLEKRLTMAIEALNEISKREGRYCRDQLGHADNCIEDMKKLAIEALTKIQHQR